MNKTEQMKSDRISVDLKYDRSWVMHQMGQMPK